MTLTKKRRFSAALCTLASLVSAQAMAWGQTGHRITGEIAERYLNPASKAAIMEILPREGLAEASTYADEMRSNPSTFWRKTASPWHYVSVPVGKHYHEVGAPEQGDAVTALATFSNTLKNPNATAEEKALALRFVVHIIGDLHQPLHAGNGTDRGGNDVKVKFFWQDSNLHRVWDSEMLDQRDLSFTEWANWLDQKITPENIAAWHSTNPEQWIKESTEIRDTIYPEDPDNMSWDYLYQNLPIAKQRLQMAGIRIALYLNQVFDESIDAQNAE